MSYFKHFFSRHFYRYLPFWLLLLVGIYTIAGFLLAPMLIEKTISEQVQLRLGWQVNIEKVELNPYHLTLSIQQLSITDQNNKEIIGFDRLYTDFTLRSIFEFALTFENIELLAPRFDLTINKDGSNNLTQALDAHAEETQEEAAVVQSESSIIPLLFDNINVKNGALSVTNYQPSLMVLHQITPISFSLQNFSTRLNEDGKYELDIALGTGQTLHWNGLIALNPIRSSGSLDIAGIKAHKFWPYLQDLIPYQLVHGIASVTGEYEVKMVKGELALEVKNSLIDIDKIKFTAEQLADGFVDIQKIKIGPSYFDLQAKKLTVEQVTVDQFSLNVLRDQQGELPMLAPLAELENKNATSSIESEPDNDLTPFNWSVGKLSIINSQVNWLDKQPKQHASIDIHDINIELNKLNQDLSSTLPFSVDYLFDSSQKNEIQGDLVINPFKLNTHLTLAGIDLTTTQPYLDEFTHLTLEKGLLFTDAEIQLSQKEDGQLRGDITGAINIKQFNSRDKALNKRLVGWQNLSIDPIEVTLNPLAIDIKKIALSQPYLRMIIAEDRRLNLSNLMVENDQTESADSADKVSKKEPDTQEEQPIRIGEISVTEGSAYFADLSLQPQFGSSIEHMNGKISGLSSTDSEPAEVDIKGRIEDYGLMSVKGKFNPFSEDLYTDINANFDKVELTTLTPYSGRYAGYVIDKGKLSLYLSYKVEKRNLVAQNRLILNQFELGKAVDSEESLNLPIKLALALFKDKDGVIDIDLPTSGNLDDPEFKITGLILQTLSNLITKAVTSPFSAIASLVDGDPEQLNSLAFELGNSDLSTAQKEQLKTLAEILIKRPQLVLEIRVKVDQDAEAEALKALHLQQLLIEADTDFDDLDKLIKSMQTLYLTRKPQSELDKIKQKATLATEQEKRSVKLTENQLQLDYKKRYQQTLNDALIETQALASLEMLNLAKQRISIIKRELIEVNNVPNAQVFALNPSLEGIAEQQKVVTDFTLNAE